MLCLPDAAGCNISLLPDAAGYTPIVLPVNATRAQHFCRILAPGLVWRGVKGGVRSFQYFPAPPPSSGHQGVAEQHSAKFGKKTFASGPLMRPLPMSSSRRRVDS